MGTVEFMVNGRKVSEIYFRNITTYAKPLTTHTYEYQLWRYGEPLRCGTVEHDRDNGIEHLSAIIIKDAIPWRE